MELLTCLENRLHRYNWITETLSLVQVAEEYKTLAADIILAASNINKTALQFEASQAYSAVATENKPCALFIAWKTVDLMIGTDLVDISCANSSFTSKFKSGFYFLEDKNKLPLQGIIAAIASSFSTNTKDTQKNRAKYVFTWNEERS